MPSCSRRTTLEHFAFPDSAEQPADLVIGGYFGDYPEMICDDLASSISCLAVPCGQAVLFFRCRMARITFTILSPNDPSSIRANAKPVTACSDRTSGSDEHPVTLLSLQPRAPLWDSFLDSPNAIEDQQLTNEIIDSAAPQAWLASISLHLVSCEALAELVQWLARFGKVAGNG